MKSRNLRSAPAEHLADLAYLIAHLKADSLAASILPDVEAELTALKTRIEDWDTKLQIARETQSGLVNTDESLCNAVRNARNTILDDLRHNRQAPKFLTYFPRGLVSIIRSTYADQLTAVRSLAERCAQDPSPKIQEQAALLRAAADQMDAALARRAQGLVAESASYGQLQVQKLQVIDTCRRVSYRLAEIYPDQRDRVRSYFRQIHRRTRSTTPTEEEPAPAAEAVATPAAAVAVPTPAPPVLVLSSAAANP